MAGESSRRPRSGGNLKFEILTSQHDRIWNWAFLPTKPESPMQCDKSHGRRGARPAILGKRAQEAKPSSPGEVAHERDHSIHKHPRDSASMSFGAAHLRQTWAARMRGRERACRIAGVFRRRARSRPGRYPARPQRGVEETAGTVRLSGISWGLYLPAVFQGGYCDRAEPWRNVGSDFTAENFAAQGTATAGPAPRDPRACARHDLRLGRPVRNGLRLSVLPSLQGNHALEAVSRQSDSLLDALWHSDASRSRCAPAWSYGARAGLDIRCCGTGGHLTFYPDNPQDLGKIACSAQSV